MSFAAVEEVGLWGALVYVSWIYILSLPSLILVSHCIKSNDRITWLCLYCVPEQCLCLGNFLSHILPQPAKVAIPWTHCVSWCSLPLEGQLPGCGPALRPSRATPRSFMLCHCLQRSVLRPYHSFLTLILSELKCCIYFLTKSCLLSWFLYSCPTTFLNKILKDTRLFICNFERSCLSFWNLVLRIGACPSRVFNGNTVLSEGHSLWRVVLVDRNSGAAGDESMGIGLSNSYLPQQNTTNPP